MSIADFEHKLHQMFCEYWSFVNDINSLIISRDYSEGIETIKISQHDGFWYVTVKILDRTNEIYTPKRINAHDVNVLSKHDAKDIKLNFYTELEDIAHKELQHLGNFTFGTVVEKERCNIKYPHNHHYITDFISLKTKDMDHIMPFLMCRYEFFKVK